MEVHFSEKELIWIMLYGDWEEEYFADFRRYFYGTGTEKNSLITTKTTTRQINPSVNFLTEGLNLSGVNYEFIFSSRLNNSSLSWPIIRVKDVALLSA